MKKMKHLSFLIMTFILVVTGCSNINGATDIVTEAKVEKIAVTVSAASSLTDCMEEIKELYESKNKNIEIIYNFGSSGSLQQQIEQGAPTDIFISAGQKQMTTLVDKDIMVHDTVKDILVNQVALIVPLDGKELTSMKELLDADIEKIAVGEPGSVPVGQYTEESLKNLNIYDKVDKKLVFAKDVKEVLSWVETGNVDAGFVYRTDAQISEKVKVVLTAPEDSHKPVIYPVGIVKDSKNIEVSNDLVDFLFESEAKEIFIKYGFSPIL